MLISIFGNTNNVSCALAHGLKSLGVNVRLVVNRKEMLHRPESRYTQYSQAYPNWIYDYSDITEEDFLTGGFRIGDVINTLNYQSDGIIFNDIGPSLAQFCSSPYLCCLSGSDITYYADKENFEKKRELFDKSYQHSAGFDYSNWLWQQFVTRHRHGIAKSNCVHAALPGLVPEIDTLLSEIGISNDKRMGHYLSHATGLTKSATSESTHRRLRILNGARLNWSEPLPPGFSSMDIKGTDVLLDGFAGFIRAGYDAELVLIKKGLHIKETQIKIRTLGLDKYIVWLDELTMNDFYREIERADIVCDQFGPSTPGLVAMDAMAMGKPVIANFNKPILSKLYPEIHFLTDTRTAVQITEQLVRLADNKEYRCELADKSERFVKENCSAEAIAKVYLKKLNLEL